MGNDCGISFIVVVRNAEKHIADLLSCYFAQDFPSRQRELIVVDGCSTDRTLDVVREKLAGQPEFDCTVLENPRKTLSTGWNMALAKAKYGNFIRVDAHATFSPDFISRNMELINEGNMIVGGRRETLPEDGKGGLLFAAETSRFGAGSSGFRNPGARRFVDTLGHAAYRKDVYQTVGGYDERLVRNQDIEIHIRMKRAGFKFLFEPSIWSSHVARPTLNSFLKQKYLNGYWGAIILSIVDRYPYYRHFAPLVLVLGLLFSLGLFFLLGTLLPLIVLGVVYFGVAMVFSVVEYKINPRARMIFLPLTFAALHLSYGVGSLVGLLGIPLFLFKSRGYSTKFPIEDKAG